MNFHEMNVPMSPVPRSKNMGLKIPLVALSKRSYPDRYHRRSVLPVSELYINGIKQHIRLCLASVAQRPVTELRVCHSVSL